MKECVQAACYMVTLVGLKVTTLSACLQTISRTVKLRDPEYLQQALIWKLRQYLAAVASGDPGFPASTCPPFDAGACNHHPSVVAALREYVRTLS